MRLKSWENVTFEISELETFGFCEMRGMFGFCEARGIFDYASGTVSHAKELTSVSILLLTGG